MDFAISNWNLSQTVAKSLKDIQVELFRRPAAPRFLHHYTKRVEIVESIVEKRELWATCIADQSDEFEISHAADLVLKSASALRRSEISEFARDVLTKLPFFMEERKRWMFIACFCDDHDSERHWRDYGDYRLTFPAPWTGVPALELSDTQAECWYQPVVYDEQAQQDAMDRALRSIAKAISENTRGRNEGPWAGAMVDSCARNTAQLLLGLAAGFKRSDYRWEREWRIVCAPRLGSNNSAPSLIDENFRPNIRPGFRVHVSLQISRPLRIFEPVMLPPVPFVDWAWSPYVDSAAVERINTALRSHGRTDLVRRHALAKGTELSGLPAALGVHKKSD